MKIRNLLILLLAAALMLSILGACGAKTPAAEPSGSGGVSDNGASVTPDDEEEAEIVEISVWLPDLGTAGSGSKADMVHEAINAITEKDLGIHVNFVWVNIADLATQFSLASANREAVDLVVTTPVPAGSFLAYYSAGMAMDISGLLEEYGQGIAELMSGLNLLDAFTMPDGGIYGIPAYRNLNTNLYVIFREDSLESAGVLEQARNMTTWGEYEEVLQAIKDKNEIWGIGGAQTLASAPYVFGTDKFSDSFVYDNLGDGMGFVYTDQKGNVYNSYTIEDLLDEYKMFKGWYDKGYVYTDTVIQQEMGLSLMKQSTIAGSIMQGEYGSTSFDQIGVPVLSIKVSSGMLSTASCTKFAVIVPSVSPEPEAAVKFLNAVYTRSDLMDLLAWGIEGETYIIDDLGYGTYKEGEDSSTCGYHSSDFIFGNQFLTLPWTIGKETPGAEMRQLSFDDFMSATPSVYMGITVDTSDYGTIVSALASIRDEYVPQLTSGLYTDSLYNEFMTKLDAAGIDEYLAVFQAAVDGFMK